MSDLPPAFFVLRTALLPWEAWLRWGEDLATPACGDAELDAALAADREQLARRLHTIVGDAQVREALLLSSRDIVAGLDRLATGIAGQRERVSLERSLARYVTRMAGRPEQLGLLGSYTLGEPGEQSSLTVCGRLAIERSSRLDPQLLQRIVASVLGSAGSPALRRNPGLYRAAGQLRVAARVADSTRHQLIAITPTDAIEAALAAAGTGAPAPEILAAIRAGGTDEEGARAVLRRLRANEMLLPCGELSPTGVDAASQASSALRTVPEAAPTLTAVRAARAVVEAAQVVTPDILATVEAAARMAGARVDRRHLVHVETRRPGRCALGPEELAEVGRARDLLSWITPPRSLPLTTFREAFERRYDGRAVPLLEALDPDCGLRLDDLGRPSAGSSPGASSPRLAALAGLLERGLAGDMRVDLSSADRRALSADRVAQITPSHLLTATLVRQGGDSDPIWLVEPEVVGDSGVRLFGRFCHTDARLRQLVQAHLRAEEAAAPEVIYAEVTAAPETDVGFTLCHRPHLGSWEIEYGGPSTLPAGQRLDPGDLLLSVEDDQVVLRSQRLGRPVIPRMSAAANLSWFSLPAVRVMLCLAGQQSVNSLRWSWDALSDAPRLPRVSCGRTVLTLERWNLLAAELADIGIRADGEGFRHLRRWRRDRKIPRIVTLLDGERATPVDFENVLSVETFLADIRGVPIIRLAEALHPECAAVTSPDGRLANRIIVPLLRTASGSRSPVHRPAHSRVPERQRRFAPGGEWLFASLYTGAAGTDQVLSSTVAPLVERLRLSGSIDRWYFIRYADPDTHLRVRFHGDADELTGEVLPALSQACAEALDTGRLHRVTIGTYEREVERYGGLRGVELMEALAEADSDAVAALLSSPARSLPRRHLAVASLAGLYGDSALPLEVATRCCAALRTQWLPVGRRPETVGPALARGEREERTAVQALLAELSDRSGDPRLEPLRNRSLRLTPVLAELRELAAADGLTSSVHEIMCSHAHMFVNRMLRRGANEDELRVHDALGRIYESRLARQRDLSNSAKRATITRSPAPR